MDKILVIDDSKFSQQMLAMYLGKDYEILTASGGMLGLQLAKTHLPEIILLDLEMPGMNGFEVLRELKKDFKTRSIPVIMITGANQSDAEEKALFLGAVDYIKKPFSELVVQSRVRTHIDLFSYRQTIEDQLLVDLDTQIPNRRSANLIISEAWEEGIEEGWPVSIGIIDIDKFIDYNFANGFQQAQMIIKKVASVVQKMAAQHDGFVARYESDRFIMVLSDTDAVTAENIANAIRLSVYDAALPANSTGDVVTISVGGSTVKPRDKNGMAAFLDRVNQKLQTAKAKGKNCVVWDS